MGKYFVLVTLKNSYLDLLDVIFIYLNVTLSIYLSCLFWGLPAACLCHSHPLPFKPEYQMSNPAFCKHCRGKLQ